MPRGKRRVSEVTEAERANAKRINTGIANFPRGTHTNTQMCPATNTSLGTAIFKTMFTHNEKHKYSKREPFSANSCVQFFEKYTSRTEPNMLGPEGMEKLCEDLGVDPANVVMLLLAYKMRAKRMGFFSKSEFVGGCEDLRADTLTKLKNKLTTLESLLDDPYAFKNVYRYAYDFAKESDQRSMDTHTAKQMLQLLLGKSWELYMQFSQFLDQSKYKVINKDQWCNILEFSRSIQIDLSNYDIDGAWPVMLDEFVEWLRQQREKKSSAITTDDLST